LIILIIFSEAYDSI